MICDSSFHIPLPTVPLKLKPFTFGEEPLKEGDTVGVQCVILSGDLPASLSWMLDGQPLVTTDNVVVSKTGSKISSLTIDSVSAKDAGNYTCVGENAVGNSTYTSTLFINGWCILGISMSRWCVVCLWLE